MSEHPTACTSRVATGGEGEEGLGRIVLGQPSLTPTFPSFLGASSTLQAPRGSYPTVFPIRSLWGQEPLRKS